MNRTAFRIILCLAVLVALTVLSVAEISAQEKPRIGVLRFTNDTTASWWTSSTGRDLQDMLAAELASTKAFSVLERKEIDAVMREQDLGASGRIDKATRAKIGKIKGAEFVVAGTVSAYQENTSGTGGGIGLFGVSIGGKKETAYMAIDLKVINTTTGEIIEARTVEATSESSGIAVGANVGVLSGGLANYEKTPAGKAIRACVIEASEYLECSLTKGKNDPCVQEYAAKESKRRQKTKGAIKLD